jgi:hypothetical protein
MTHINYTHYSKTLLFDDHLDPYTSVFCGPYHPVGEYKQIPRLDQPIFDDVPTPSLTSAMQLCIAFVF